MDEQASKRNRDDGNGDDERVREWEAGLPNTIDLTPLSQALISPELASAFSITAEPHRSMVEVNRESQKTLTNLRRHNSGFSSNNLKSFMEDRSLEQEENDHEKRKIQRVDSIEESDSALVTENCNDDNDQARTLKKARLVWTPQLHKRFVEVVAHLGIKNAVPKTIMQLMNVEGLTRENVASHLQKYRLYLKRMQGLTTEGPSASDQLFASTPVPPNLCEPTGGGGGYIQAPPTPAPAPAPAPPMGYGAYGAPMSGPYGHMGMPSGNQASGGYHPASGGYHGFESHHHPYNMYREQQGDWSGNRFGSVVPYSHSNHNNK